jgi:hypothetical protein
MQGYVDTTFDLWRYFVRRTFGFMANLVRTRRSFGVSILPRTSPDTRGMR